MLLFSWRLVFIPLLLQTQAVSPLLPKAASIVGKFLHVDFFFPPNLSLGSIHCLWYLLDIVCLFYTHSQPPAFPLKKVLFFPAWYWGGSVLYHDCVWKQNRVKWLGPLWQLDQKQGICPVTGSCFPIWKQSQLCLNYNTTSIPTKALHYFLWRHLLKELSCLIVTTHHLEFLLWTAASSRQTMWTNSSTIRAGLCKLILITGHFLPPTYPPHKSGNRKSRLWPRIMRVFFSPVEENYCFSSELFREVLGTTYAKIFYSEIH